MENFTLAGAEALLNSFDELTLVVLAAFILSLFVILIRIGISDFFALAIGSLVVFGVPCFVAYYFFDYGLITASSSNQGKVELTIMSYVVMALFIMACFGTKSKAQKKRDEAAEKAEQSEEEARHQAEREESARKAAEQEKEKARKAAERADSLSELSKRVASKEAERAEEEAKRAAEEKARLEKEAEELRVYLEGLPENIVKSFKREKICLDMPMKLVGKLHGRKYEEKRSVTKKVEKLTYKYEKNGTNLRGKPQYKLEVSYVDGRVDSFRDL